LAKAGGPWRLKPNSAKCIYAKPERPAKQQKTKDAVAIMELNVEVNTPPSLWSYNLLAMAHAANKETDKAKADYKKILELNPQDAFAKKQLEELNRGKQ
jgi:tetratricopeptide (TPR) repeat protein